MCVLEGGTTSQLCVFDFVHPSKLVSMHAVNELLIKYCVTNILRCLRNTLTTERPCHVKRAAAALCAACSTLEEDFVSTTLCSRNEICAYRWLSVIILIRMRRFRGPDRTAIFKGQIQFEQLTQLSSLDK